MLDVIKDARPPSGHEPGNGENGSGPELTRKGFILTYPMFRYWTKDAAGDGLAPRPLNLYIHMPFCIQRCAYCYFKTTTLKENRLEQIDRYTDSVCRELELASERFHLGERPVETIYFGGGTPSLMSEENIGKLFTALRANFNIERPQITFEGEPVTLSERKAEILQRHGVNRISLGIQSFKEEIVFQTGRRDTEEQSMLAIALAKSTGADVNIDLISGLAGESEETWAYSVRRALEAAPDNITIYKLELYANTPYYTADRNQQISLPDDEQELAFMTYAVDELRAAGYVPVNTFTFTKGGESDQLHTRSNWLGNDNYASGVSAYGAIGAWNYQNVNDIHAYTETVEAGRLPAFRGHTCSTFDLMVRDVVMGIKLVHFDHALFREKHGFDLLHACGDEIERLRDEGFLGYDEQRISLTDRGLIFGDYVGRCLERSLKRHAGTDAKSRARVHF
jgi:oxygen-independent coproporphyrinogen-3 oxidase